MKISYNWLKEYINIDLEPEIVSNYLTNIGLEVEGTETIESIKGGLQGLVIGQVITKEQHPNADRLSLTTIDIGQKEHLQIVCGAPNVQAGQKVVVATIGTKLYSGDESFKIKKGKIRGHVSEGMICAEDEIGLGESHDGIMVLDPKAKIGQLASTYFNIDTDIIFEIGLTPNRSDAMSHVGVARDLAAVLNQNNIQTKFSFPDISQFKEGQKENIKINIHSQESCPRYAGICLDNIKVQPSPDWLKNRLKAIGLTPINNVVDVTNFVLHELGQPLHAFDTRAIKNQKVIVKTLNQNENFVTLDEKSIKLSDEDLMICNGNNEPMCIAGVFGGLDSGVNNNTTSIFLESAYFNPVNIRKTAKRHGLSTDASFRFERGVDPLLIVYALKRAANLMVELCNATISSKIIEFYPEQIKPIEIYFSYDKMDTLIGQKLDRKVIQKILKSLDIEILKDDSEGAYLKLPPYRTDVQREEDVIEEILRIYGYNNIEVPAQLRSSLSYTQKPNAHTLQNTISNLLSNNGFSECINNSLIKASYSKLIDEINDEEQVVLINPQSQDLDGMRQSLLFSGLDNLSYNLNRKSHNLSFYEFGKTYHSIEGGFKEKQKLMLLCCGNSHAENWDIRPTKKDFFWLKKQVDHILKKLGIYTFKGQNSSSSYLIDAYSYVLNNKNIAHFGYISDDLRRSFNIKTEVLYAEIDWDLILKYCQRSKTIFKEVNKFPSVKRDLALLIDKDVEFSSLNSLALQTENKLLKSINLFDVYEGDKLPKNKKSYALSFTLESNEKTLTDKDIDQVMNRLIKTFEQKVGAEVRK